MLQMQWKEPAGDPSWVDLILEFDDNAYLILAPAILQSVASRQCAFGLGGLDHVLDDLHDRLRDANLAHNAEMQLLVITFLQSTLHLWLDSSVAQGSVGRKARELFAWLVNMVEKGRCESWRVRDQLVSLLDRYAASDPSQVLWVHAEEDETKPAEDPISSLKRLALDRDVRVRYRAVIGTARLFRYTLNSYQMSSADESSPKASALYVQVSLTDTAVYEKYVPFDYDSGNFSSNIP